MIIKQYNIKSFNHFVEILNVNRNDDRIRLFRGQDEDLPLYSKLYRYAIKFKRTNEVYDIEKRILNEFKKTVLNKNSINVYNDWDCLTLAQHYCLPTRFLDWSGNPFVALWFAFEKLKINGENRVVWGMIVEDDFYIDFDNESPFNTRFIKVLKPNLIDVRVVAQDSWFSIQDIQFFGKGGDGLPHFNTNDPLEEHEEFNYFLAKFIFPDQLRSDILENLKSVGITNSFIYPDLTTICNQIWPNEFRNNLLDHK